MESLSPKIPKGAQKAVIITPKGIICPRNNRAIGYGMKNQDMDGDPEDGERVNNAGSGATSSILAVSDDWADNGVVIDITPTTEGRVAIEVAAETPEALIEYFKAHLSAFTECGAQVSFLVH